MAAGWAVMWGVVSYWNPLAFTGMWTGAALVMWNLGRHGYPGIRSHLALAALSVPLWWWFELVNARAKNWHYVYEPDYSPLEFWALSSIAFATVIPAVVAAHALIGTRLDRRREQPGAAQSDGPPGPGTAGAQPARASVRKSWRCSAGAGLLLQALVFAFPTRFYPFEWVAPFLVIDGLLERSGGPGLIAGLLDQRRRARLSALRDATAIAAAGLLCGVLWEFWNFWSSPRWEYSVPLLGFWKVFEMPLLGYAGYVPFAWSVVQLVRLVGIASRTPLTYGSPRRGLPEPPP